MEIGDKTKRRKNPREGANPLAVLNFAYMIPIFIRNYKKGLQEEDLYLALDEHKSSKLGDQLERIWKEENEKGQKWALHRALVRQFWSSYVITGCLKLTNDLIQFIVIPMSISGLIGYFQDPSLGISNAQAYVYAGLIIGSLGSNCIIHHPVMMYMMHINMKMRVACCSLVYRKALRLSRPSLAQTTIGQIINLLSNDVSKFDQDFMLFHYVWLAPLLTILGTGLLYRIIGVSAFSGIGFLLLFIPLQIYLGKNISVIRKRTALRTDERVRLMNEILNGIQVIKMYTWEKPFTKLVAFARRYEIISIRAYCYVRGIMLSLTMFITRTSIFISIIVFIALGNNITADKAYAMTTIYNLLRPVITLHFSISVASVAEVHVSIGRLQKFLALEEIPHEINYLQAEKNGSLELRVQKNPIPNILLKQVNVKWTKSSPENTLSNVNVSIDENQLIAVIGPVGSGKSSLFNVLLKELPILNGYMQIFGKISYASQEAWLFSASVKQNILFGDEYNEERYKAIIKICALEEDLASLPYGDRTLVGEKGKALSSGQKARVNLARCIYKRADIYLLDDPLSAVDANVGKQLYDRCIKKFLCDKICILITHQLQYLKNADKILILTEGRIVGERNYNELQTSGLDFAKLLKEFQSDEEQGDAEKKMRQNSIRPLGESEDGAEEQEVKEILTSGSLKATIYRDYFRAGGNYFVIFFLLFLFVAAQASGNVGDYFVSYWVNLEQTANELAKTNSSSYQPVERDRISYIYSGIIVATIILALVHSIAYFLFVMKASTNLHNHMFEMISRATMRFFNRNPIGRILNRISKDIGIIDEYLPFILSDVIEIALIMVGTIAVSAVVNPWVILPSAGLLFVFYALRCICLETSRSVKRIEGITRSPIFNHINASINGLSTIRAFGVKTQLTKEFDNYQDHHSSAWYIFISSTRAFGFWLDCVCTYFIALIIISLLIFNNEYYGGDVGLVITQYLGLTGVLQWGMTQWSELENNMTSVERVLKYDKVESEPERVQKAPLPKIWPELGRIVFKDVSLRYNPNEEAVLKNLDFTINPHEKIGVVGRTGAGKTSTIAALFQLYDMEGSIIIDEVDTTILPLDVARAKLSIIPQEPALFSGTMRKNLDPFEEYSDEVLWSALEQVELKEIIEEAVGGLNANVSESGFNFSIGQRQLVCLARAIIRNNKILIMDEATANVDPHTDSLIQKTTRKQFEDCTVITIAHRLHTIMDSDRVLVMDAGRVVEFDQPYNLLQKNNGIFYTMVQTTGKTISGNWIMYDWILINFIYWEVCSHLIIYE